MMSLDGIISIYSESIKLAENNKRACEMRDDHEEASDWEEDAKFSREIISLLKELQEFRKQPKIINCNECERKLNCPKKIDCGNGLYYAITYCSNGKECSNNG